ncbi:MAG: competence/damage-inducible protein A [Clostridiales bacterium]|jgi:nicotinamide-nucleotide amidase|nr:competence/damage-inducible protein A [Clostridiales bacterium]
MIAEIICVGTEILLGDIINTNASYMAKGLAEIGIFSYYQTVVGDNIGRAKGAFSTAFGRADIVITSGGLGPTKDDLTKEAAAEFFNKPLILDNNLLAEIKNYFKGQNFTFTENNERQAYIIEGATALKNNNGTAPGLFYEQGGKMLFMLPGPPNELKPMFGQVIKYLDKKTDSLLSSRTLRVCGVGESLLEDKLKSLLETQTNPTLALYAKDSEVHIRLTAKANSKEEADLLIAPYADKIYNILGSNIYAEGSQPLESALIDILRKKRYTLSIAESCTGGMISSAIVGVSGCSDTYSGSFITYSNGAKIKSLGVNPKTLEKFGAVSKETAIEMAIGCARALNTETSISVTGVAGPGGGSLEKPVGLIYIGLYICGETYYKELNLKGDRQKIRSRSTIQALDFLRRELLKA